MCHELACGTQVPASHCGLSTAALEGGKDVARVDGEEAGLGRAEGPQEAGTHRACLLVWPSVENDPASHPQCLDDSRPLTLPTQTRPGRVESLVTPRKLYT